MDIKLEGKNTGVKFTEPNQSQIFELDKFYRKIFSECIREGIMTEAEAKKRFASTGAWTTDEEAEIQTLIQKIAYNSAKLLILEEMSPDAGKLIDLIQEDRSSMFELISRKTELLSNTSEGMANEQKVFKYISLCLCTEDGHRIFDSEESLEKYAVDNRDDFSTVVQKAYSLVYGIDSEKDITEDWAEVQFLSNISADEHKPKEQKKKKSPKKRTPKKKSSK